MASTNGIDETAAHELSLYADNDAFLHRRYLNFIASVQRKIKAKKYDEKKAPKLWIYWVDEAAKKYCTEFGGTVATVFPKKTREHVAAVYAKSSYAGIMAGEYKDMTAPGALEAAVRHLPVR